MQDTDCPFCVSEGALFSNAVAFVRYEKHPLADGHMLILPRRHIADWFKTTVQEREAILALADEARSLLIREFAPDGFNLEIAVGEAAGQTVFHTHLRLIARHRGAGKS